MLPDPAAAPRRVLLAHPSPDRYGSDLAMLSAALGLQARGWEVTVAVPEHGELVDRLREHDGLAVRIVRFPVLRKSLLSPRGFLSLVLGLLPVLVRLVKVIRAVRPGVVYVNTLTMPWWLVAARLARVPVVVHVREAEEDSAPVIRWLLAVPLLVTQAVVVNSKASLRVLLHSVGRLRARSVVVYNGMSGPDDIRPLPESNPSRLALVARLSPRKGVDVALEALALLRREGRDVVLDVCGTTFPGYEWFEAELRSRAADSDLAGATNFLGYVNPTWAVLEQAHVVLVPSRVEPFGNTAVEAQLAARPVIASAVQGLVEIVSDGRTGLLVEPDDAVALARAIARVLDDRALATAFAETGRAEAMKRYSPERYGDEIARVLAAVADGRPAPATFSGA